MKYGFIGAGNMASAIIKGMTRGTESRFDGKDVSITSRTVVSAEELAKACGANACRTGAEVVAASDVLVLAVKPQMLAEVVPALAEAIEVKAERPLVVSIAAGKTLEYLEGLLPTNTPIVRVMPNINAKIGASTSGLCANALVSEEQKQVVREMFLTIGTVAEIEEKQFGIFSVIGGASVAFAYMYMDALARAALKAGMPKKQALQITAETVLGSARMVLESGEAPWPLVDQVCSPGGTTIEGVTMLQAEGFESALTKAFDAVLEKDARLGKQM